MKRIVYMNGGALCVAVPVINTHPEPENITENEAVARAMAKLPASATDIRVLPESAIPSSREHRALWVYNAGKTAVIEEPAALAAANAEKARLAEIDQAIAGDNFFSQFRGLNNAGFNNAWTSLTDAEKGRALKLLVRYHIRRA